MRYVLYSFLLLTSTCSLVYAKQHEPLAPVGQYQFDISLGYGGIQNPVAGRGNITTYALPNFSYYGERFYIEDFSLGYSLYEAPNFYIDLYSSFNEDGFFFELDGLSKFLLTDVLPTGRRVPPKPGKPVIEGEHVKRELSYLAGLAGAYYNEYGTFRFSHLYDILNTHDGYETQLSWAITQEYLGALMEIELGATYKSDNLTSYYYEVRPEEEPYPLKDQKIDAAINPFIKLKLYIPINERLGIDTNLSRHLLDSTYQSSYLIDETGYWSGFIGINYRF